jgi:hypothetical protein
MSPGGRVERSQRGRGAGNAPGDTLVVHPRTGEIVGAAAALETLPGETLADVYAELDATIAQLREMRELVDHELVRRLDEAGRSKQLIGDYELALEGRRESVWDAHELEATMQYLVDEGVLDASECVGIVSHEPSVSRRAAQSLTKRLSGAPLRAVESCRSWQTGRRTLHVTRSLPLIPPQD